MSMLDLFLTDPTDPVERAQALAGIEELRAMGPLCDCDRCCADPTCCPHESWCPAVAGDASEFCTGCGTDHDPAECGYNPANDYSEYNDPA